MVVSLQTSTQLIDAQKHLAFVCTVKASWTYCAVVYLEKLQELFTCPLHSETVGQNEHYLVRFMAKRQEARDKQIKRGCGRCLSKMKQRVYLEQEKTLNACITNLRNNKGIYPFMVDIKPVAKAIDQSFQESGASARGG